jgi:hypothetical protein
MRVRSGKGYVDVTATDCLGDAGSLWIRIALHETRRIQC